jgi:D-3-phosphoglycerate dehydrogenase
MALLGVGQIGREVIGRARSFGTHVRAWSRSLTPEIAASLGVQFAATPLDACRGADVLSLHLALTPETRGLVGRELLEALAPGAFVINTSRGGVMDQDALVQAIHTRGLRAGLDVFAEEPVGGDAPFPFDIADEAGVYGTHHIGASTDQATLAVADEVVRIITTFQRRGTAPNCVNLSTASVASHVLIVRHADEVGVLAGILERLREDGVNVQEMDNIIFKGGGAASARIQVTGAPSPACLERIEHSSTVFAASLIPLESP